MAMQPSAEPTAFPHSGPVRIGFCITELDDGGAERALARIATGLDRRCWDPFVICLAPEGPLAEPLRGAGIETVCLNLSGARHFWKVPRLLGCLRAQRPRLLQTFLYHANILGRCCAAAAGVEVVVSGVRVAERRSRFRLQVDRWTRRLVDCHVCVSHAVAEFSIEHGLDRRRVRVIPNGVDYERFAQATPVDLSSEGVPAEARVAVFVGRLDPQKAPEQWLRAFAELAERFPDLHTVLVGDGPLRSALQAQAAAAGLQTRVHFLGRRNDVPGLLRRADCFVLTSRWEGMPNVLLEAMAAGRPCVATAVEGVTELLRPRETGWLVPCGDPQALAAAVSDVLRAPAEAHCVAQSAQNLVREHFTWQHVLEAYDTLYRELLGLPRVAE